MLSDELGFSADELLTILNHNITQTEPGLSNVPISNWMSLLPYQLRSFHRSASTPLTVQTDDTSEENQADDGNDVQLGSEKESSKLNSLPIAFIPTIVPLPKSLTWIKLRDNYRVDDQTVLRYIPYFGDDDTTGLDLSAYELVPWELEGDIGGEVIETTISTIMNRYQHLFESEEDVLLVKEIKSKDAGGKEEEIPSSLESLLMKLFSLSVTQLRQAKKHGDMYSDLLKNQISIPREVEQKLVARQGSSAFLPLFLRATKESLTHHLDDIALDQYGYRNKSDYKSVAENYLDMFCRRCYKYDCRTHGIEQPKQRFHEDPPEILAFNENGIIIPESSLNRRNKRKKAQVSASVSGEISVQEEFDDSEKCDEAKDTLSSEYYQASDGTLISYGRYHIATQDGIMTSPTKKRKSVSEKSHRVTLSESIVASRLRDMIFSSYPAVLQEYQQQSSKLPLSVTSKIAFLLGTCTPQEVDEICSGYGSTQSGGKKSHKQNSDDPNQKKKTQTKSVKDSRGTEILSNEENEKVAGPLFNLGTALTNIRKDGFSLVHQPCDHEGPCVLGICPCVDSTGYCETDCACSTSCKNRFQGCKCTPGHCRTLL